MIGREHGACHALPKEVFVRPKIDGRDTHVGTLATAPVFLAYSLLAAFFRHESIMATL